jgi:lysyl-tRNA synthetase class II
LIEVKVDEKLFKSRVLGVKDGDIVGIKGRLVSTNNLISLMCERLQVF